MRRLLVRASLLGYLSIAAGAGAQSLLGEESAIEGESMTPGVESVLADFKRAEVLDPREQPTRSLRANFFGGPREEQLFAYRSTLVFLGGDLAVGSYYAIDVPLPERSNLLYLGAADVTGDGRSELFARTKQPLEGHPGVWREILIVMRVNDRGQFGPALAREVVRREGENVIVNRVQTAGGELVLVPEHSAGWTAESYPFREENPAPYGRLLLPWADAPVHYHLDAEKLVPAQ